MDTRIESCSHVKVTNGKAYAVPFIPKKKRTYADKMLKSSETQSVAQYGRILKPFRGLKLIFC